MITITFNAQKLTGEISDRDYFLKESFNVEDMESAIWYFGRIVKMLDFSEETLYGMNMCIMFNAKNETSEVQLGFGCDEDIILSEVIWEFANALTYTDSQCDEIINIIFNEEE